MIEIRNLLFQPLTLHLADGTGIHIGSRRRAKVQPDQVSAEIRTAAARGLAAVSEVAESTPAAPRVETPAPEQKPASKTTGKTRRRRKS